MPVLACQLKDTESITGFVVGNVTSAVRKEVLFTCYSGAVKSLVDRRQARKLGTTTEDTKQMTDAQIKQEKSAKFTVLTSEVAKLEQKLEQEEHKVQEKAEKQKQIPKKASAAAASQPDNTSAVALVAGQGFKIDSKLNLIS
jgi:hypothetical protein